MKPFLKWPGGKASELNFININKPKKINKFVEPFVGGGAVFFDISDYNEAYINDISKELISLYLFAQENNTDFFDILYSIDNSWTRIKIFLEFHLTEFLSLYTSLNINENENEIKVRIEEFFIENIHNFKFEETLDERLYDRKNILKVFKSITFSKFKTIKKNEIKNGKLSEEDIILNLECSLKSSFYTYLRNLYNMEKQLGIHSKVQIAIFFYLREYCYSSMFRYNSRGDFNVPYGGISYNKKSLNSKIDYLKSDEMKNKLKNVVITRLDFEEQLVNLNLTEDDFLFLDPPYDTTFSEYAENSFEKNDQERLANFLINSCPAKFMLIIKNTDFIYNLYSNKENINLTYFDKNYSVSFKDRNDKKVQHLLITNYN